MGRPKAGLSIVELSIVLAMAALFLAPMGLIVHQFFAIPLRASATHKLLQDVQQATFLIAEDARNAESFTPGSAPEYGTFSWVDRINSPITTHSVLYTHSSGDNNLLRVETIDSGPSTTETVARTIQNQGDVTIQETSGLILASITASTGTSLDLKSKTGEIRSRLRRSSPSAQPAPPPHRLAWDDFESDDFSGGSGWLEDWFTQGQTAVVSGNGPFEGAFHMRLRRNSARVERSLDLSGELNVRIQFNAKADAFNPGETVLLQVSDNFGGTFVTVRTWVDGEDDNVGRFEDIDISSFTMTDELFIAFESTITGGQGQFFVDDLEIVRTWSG